MQLRVTTENAQRGNESVEIVNVYDGDMMVARIEKIGNSRPIVTDLAILEAVMVGEPKEQRPVSAENADQVPAQTTKRRVKVGK